MNHFFFSIFAVGSKDATVRLYTLKNYSNFRPYSLIGHSDVIVGIFFEQNSLDLMTISRYVVNSSTFLIKLIPYITVGMVI
jgi:WD40 repeat protein